MKTAFELALEAKLRKLESMLHAARALKSQSSRYQRVVDELKLKMENIKIQLDYLKRSDN